MKNALVYGFARAGTSMACGLINCLGIHMLTSVPKPRQLTHNPKGMFEVPAHISLGKVLRERAEQSNDYEAHAKELDELIANSFRNYMPEEGSDWGVKGFSVEGQQTLLYYMDNPYVVAIFRNPINQAKSFQTMRNDKDGVLTPLEDLIAEMVRNQARMVHEIGVMRSHGFPVIETTYEDMKLKPVDEAERIAKFMGIDMNPEMRESVLEFIDPQQHTWKHDGTNVVSTVA